MNYDIFIQRYQHVKLLLTFLILNAGISNFSILILALTSLGSSSKVYTIASQVLQLISSSQQYNLKENLLLRKMEYRYSSFFKILQLSPLNVFYLCECVIKFLGGESTNTQASCQIPQSLVCPASPSLQQKSKAQYLLQLYIYCI